MNTILQVCAFGAPNPGNFIASLLNLQAKMEKHGYKTIYAFPEKAREKEWCQLIAENNRVYFLPEAKARILPKTYQIFKQIYKENQIKIIHSHFELYDIPATVMAPKSAKIFWHLHDALEENYRKGTRSRKFLTKIQYGFFGKKAVLLSVSKAHAHFAETLGFPKNQIYYLPNGINTDRIIHIDQKNRTSDFLMFGWDVQRKGVDLAIEAMHYLKTDQIRIVVVGESECKRYLKDNAVPGILYQEPVADVNELYSKAKAFLHISRAEGLSYALLEAIYAGLSVICSDIPENQFARKFRGIYFVKNEDPVGIAHKINDVNSQILYSKENEDYNRSLIEKQYSLNAWCTNLLKFYLDC